MLTDEPKEGGAAPSKSRFCEGLEYEKAHLLKDIFILHHFCENKMTNFCFTNVCVESKEMRFRSLVLRCLLFVYWLAPVQAETVTTTPWPGVTHIIRTDEQPRKVSIHIVKIDLTTSGFSFKLTAPSGSRETVRQTTLDFLNQEKAQIALNGHFFTPYPSQEMESFLVGFAASGGKVFSDFEQPVQSYAIVANAPALNIDDENNATIVTLDSVAGTKIGTAISGSAQIITNGLATVPFYKDGHHPDGLLTPGGPAGYSNAKSWYDVPNARTVIGLSEDNRTLFLFTVDRAGASQGMKLSEVAELLVKEYGVNNALNLDGGGSTTLAMEDPKSHEARIVNASSDNPNGRAVASSLAVFVK